MRITHLGHACLMVETGGARILLDPGSFSAGFDVIEGLDAVLVTHQHLDHVDADRLPALLAASPDAALVTEASTADRLRESALTAEPLRPGESRRFGRATVQAVGGRHTLMYPDDPVVGNVGLLVRADGEPTLFHPGDSYDVAPDGVDVLALPLSAPWTGCRGTVDFVRAVAPRVAVPIHDGLLKPAGRDLYLMHVGNRGPGSMRVLDLADAGPTEV